MFLRGVVRPFFDVTGKRQKEKRPPEMRGGRYKTAGAAERVSQV
jgi:hypothetical protein